MTKRSIFATLAALCVSVAFFSCNHALSEQSALPFLQQSALISIALPKELGDAMARYAAPRAAMSRQAASDGCEGIIRIELIGGITRTENFAWSGEEKSLTCTIGNLTVGTTVTVDVSALVSGVKLYETKNPPSVTLTSGPNVTNVTLTRVEIPLNITFVRINGATVTANIGDTGGPFASAGTTSVTVNAFDIAETELTYAQWYEVYQWARADGYTFANPGREGNDGTDGAAPTQGNSEPVTMVSWRDAVVWCNAASEREGLLPVYLISGQPVRESEGTNVTAGSGKAEQATVDESANGYRLPTDAEWEFAARGGIPSTEATAPWNYTYAGSNDINAVAWYADNSGGTTHDVRKTQPNSAGLYDMSGNVWEWCWDTYSSPPRHRHRGGSWDYNVSGCTVAYRGGQLPSYCFGSDGFRVVRSVVQQ